jgi:hypothetical protein
MVKVTLVCVVCQATKTVQDDPVRIATGQRMTVTEWWDYVGRMCKTCRALPSPAANQAKLARHATDTSRAAADLVRPRSGTQRMRVLEALIRSDGLTDLEIAIEVGLQENSERPRRIELVEAGWVRDSGQRRATNGRAEAIVWALTERAHDELRVAVA